MERVEDEAISVVGAPMTGDDLRPAVLSISNNGTNRDPRELLLWRGNAELHDGPVVASALIDRL